ncbi:hypothetical protein HA402_014226 [Bradysia odoriphaga]|nr:hypothetical protein HA402_014226 [Bradysia odoriphaga]
METENLYKELEPDANEIMFGQKTLPDRPLTMKEESKRKKILLKLVDQKLKFKLVEMMRQQVDKQHKQETSATTIPTVCHAINNYSQPTYGSNGYQSQSNWSPWSDSGVQHAEGNWQQHYPDGSQASAYQLHYGTIVDKSWSSHQPNVQPNEQDHFRYAHQNVNPTMSLKRKHIQNPHLINPPMVDARGPSNNQILATNYADMRVGTNNKMIPASQSSLIPINCTQKPPNSSTVIHPLTKNHLLATTNVPIPKIHQTAQRTNSNAMARTTSDGLKPRRRRRYGRGKNNHVKASAQTGDNVALRDTFGLQCISTVASDTTTDGNGLWNEISRLVSSIFRKESNQIEPLSAYEQKLQNRILIEISTNPDVLRSDKDVSQFLSRSKIEEMISKVKRILEQVKQSNAQVQNDFAQFRDNLIGDLKALHEKVNVANDTENVQLIQTKINEVVGPFLLADVDENARNNFVSKLVINPRSLETSEALTKPIPDKMNVMREIKRILDEHMTVRPGKRFYIPIHRTIDVPFVVAVHEKSNKMSEENLKILLDALIAKVDSVVSLLKPKIIDPKCADGTLVMVCANRKTFDLIKTTISGNFDGKWTGADLTVTPAQIQNPLARSELKTVRMKFTEPQFYHFNDLMVQLKIDNPSLLVRRWELREPPAGKVIDPTEEIYVGVDMESLGPIEQLNRVAVLLKSTVTFELHKYDWSDLNVSNVNTFPSAKDLACLSYAVYYQKYGSNVTYNISESIKDQPTIKPLPDSWKLIATARCKVLSVWPVWPLSFGDGYHGAAYYNVSSKHLVIAHRGTNLTNLGSIWADIVGVTLSRYTSQVNSAYQFTKQIVDRFWECAISISVTGHSLGGWLSQTSAFFIKYPDLAVDFMGVASNFTVDVVDLHEFNSSDHLPSHHLHVVAFDSPGALNAMEEYFFKHYPRYSDNRFVRMKYLNDLDVTTYFSYPNVVNSVKMHIGSLFMMPGINTHKMKNILQFWQSDESADQKLLKVMDWLKGLTEQNLHHTKVQFDNELANSQFLAEPINPNSVRMSTFELEEWEFLDDIRFLKKYGVQGEKISWKTLFKDKPIATANAIFSGGKFADYTEAKNIFEFFDSFDIVDSQVLEVDKRFKIEFFIRLVKYFVRNSDLPAVVKEVISEFPKVYEAIYRAFEKVYLNSVIEVNASDFPLLQEFLESSQLKVYQAVAVQNTLVCVAKIVSSLKSERFSFCGDVDVRLDMKNTLFLSSELLTVSDRHVNIEKIVPPNDDFKLIVIENRDKEIQPTLKFLIDKVLGESTNLVKLILVTRQKIDFQDCTSQMHISPFYLKKEIEVSDQSILFDHLTIDQQTKVLDSEICFQGEDMQLKNLVSLEDLQLTSDSLDQVTLCHLLSPTNFIGLNKSIVVQCTTERAKANYHCFQSHFELVRPTMTRFVYETDSEHWDLTTMGNNLKISYEERCNEQELLELQQHLVIISDDPGMGKSTILKKLAEQCKGIGRDAGRACWLFMLGTVSLPSVCSFLTEVQSNDGQITDCMLEQNLLLYDNIFHLYRIFIEEKIHISLKEKLKLKQMAENHPWHFEQLLASLIELHRATSFRFIFPNECQEFLCSNSVSSIEENQALLSVGIIQSEET